MGSYSIEEFSWAKIHVRSWLGSFYYVFTIAFCSSVCVVYRVGKEYEITQELLWLIYGYKNPELNSKPKNKGGVVKCFTLDTFRL